jgi:NhaP-type Na+/H+ or K+/H+ antiporter
MLLFADLTLWEAALLAAILAPTDAALGLAVITNPQVPVRIRQALNVESGLNDGIALSVVLVFAALASTAHEPAEASYWFAFAVKQVGLGPLAGILVGYCGAKLVATGHRKGWTTETAE